MKPIPTVFIGTSVEGISSLKSLVKHPQFEIAAVLTQPDKPVGRKQKLQATAINKAAQELNLPVHTSDEKEDMYSFLLDEYHVELAIVISYGNMIPKEFLDKLKYGCVNVHYSLLPILRGAVPVQKAILDGHRETGITIQKMVFELDEGPILAQESIPIKPTDTTETLKEQLIPLGEKLLMEAVPAWINGKLEPKEQDHSKATYCTPSDIAKENAEIDWKKQDPEYIEQMVRALLPWPVAWCILPNRKRLKIYSAKLAQLPGEKGNAGEILPRKDGLYFVTRKPGTLLHALEVQPEGKRKMSGEAFVQGYHA